MQGNGLKKFRTVVFEVSSFVGNPVLHRILFLFNVLAMQLMTGPSFTPFYQRSLVNIKNIQNHQLRNFILHEIEPNIFQILFLVYLVFSVLFLLPYTFFYRVCLSTK